jgi:hypothetical protein
VADDGAPGAAKNTGDGACALSRTQSEPAGRGISDSDSRANDNPNRCDILRGGFRERIMRKLIALVLVTALPAVAIAAPSKVRRIATTDEEAACERKADGLYCGRGIKNKTLYKCEDGHVAQFYRCDWGCNPATVACYQKRKKEGGNMLPR